MKGSLGYTVVTVVIVMAVIAVMLGGTWIAQEVYTSRSEFCGGSCHTMTEQFNAWKADTHHADNNAAGNQAECIECHFLPGEKHGVKAKLEGLRHLAAYLYNPEAPLPIRPVIPDGACLQSGCHAVEKFQDKELPFTDKVRFKHAVHFSDQALKGQALSCDTCHFKVTAEKHFEVPQQICFLCHLKLEKPTLDSVAIETLTVGESRIETVSFKKTAGIGFNQGISKCSICHTIPTQSLQSQLSSDDADAKPITHQTIEEAGVACEGCHFEVVKGQGEVNLGNVVSGGCLTCHNRSDELLTQAGDGALMHDQHIAQRRADCFDCHSVIEHRNRTDHLDFVRQDCALCHQDQHRYQKILLAGVPVIEGASATPHLMYNVNSNCMACHLKKTLNQGHAVRSGAPETCVACHTPEHEQMLTDWQQQVGGEVTFAEELETEALATLARASGGADEVKLKQAAQMLTAGQEFLNIVRLGNGVHNKKYSIKLIDEAIANFEDAIDLLQDGE
ncbi:MAG: NapC/NirT family cytochrome c [Motiliproteus sp.]